MVRLRLKFTAEASARLTLGGPHTSETQQYRRLERGVWKAWACSLKGANQWGKQHGKASVAQL